VLPHTYADREDADGGADVDGDDLTSFFESYEAERAIRRKRFSGSSKARQLREMQAEMEAAHLADLPTALAEKERRRVKWTKGAQRMILSMHASRRRTDQQHELQEQQEQQHSLTKRKFALVRVCSFKTQERCRVKYRRACRRLSISSHTITCGTQESRTRRPKLRRRRASCCRSRLLREPSLYSKLDNQLQRGWQLAARRCKCGLFARADTMLWCLCLCCVAAVPRRWLRRGCCTQRRASRRVTVAIKRGGSCSWARGHRLSWRWEGIM
jgi:hypothetical protein